MNNDMELNKQIWIFGILNKIETNERIATILISKTDSWIT